MAELGERGLMRLGMLMLADNAAGADGKLYIHGGGISRITPPTIPWTHPMLTLVLRLDFDSIDDILARHELVFAILDPEGTTIAGPGDLTLDRDEPPPGILKGEPLYTHVALTIAPITFEREGLHEVHIDLDGAPAIRLALPVAAVPTPPGEIV